MQKKALLLFLNKDKISPNSNLVLVSSTIITRASCIAKSVFPTETLIFEISKSNMLHNTQRINAGNDKKKKFIQPYCYLLTVLLFIKPEHTSDMFWPCE